MSNNHATRSDIQDTPMPLSETALTAMASHVTQVHIRLWHIYSCCVHVMMQYRQSQSTRHGKKLIFSFGSGNHSKNYFTQSDFFSAPCEVAAISRIMWNHTF